VDDAVTGVVGAAVVVDAVSVADELPAVAAIGGLVGAGDSVACTEEPVDPAAHAAASSRSPVTPIDAAATGIRETSCVTALPLVVVGRLPDASTVRLGRVGGYWAFT
jgi:hypothetical protein